MKIKLSKKVIRCIVIGLVVFMVGFFAARLLTPPGEGKGSGGSSGPGNMTPVLEKRQMDFTIIIIFLVVLVALIGYGYYREKKKRKRLE
jgi:membrane protein DedA with SNARE-associated domain